MKIDLSIPFLSPWNTCKERSYDEYMLHEKQWRQKKKKKQSRLKNHHTRIFTRITYKSIPILIYIDYTLFFHMPQVFEKVRITRSTAHFVQCSLSWSSPSQSCTSPASPISANGIFIQLLETLLSHSQYFALHHPQTLNSSASSFILQNIPLIYLFLSSSVITLV